MSDAPAGSLNLESLLVDLARKRAETEKFIAEQRKLMAESAKLDGDRRFTPWLAAAAIFGGMVGLTSGIVSVIASLARMKGVGP
jgi:hypothetical protein